MGKRKCRAAPKDHNRKILYVFLIGNDAQDISNLLSRVKTNRTNSIAIPTTAITQAVLESTGNMRMRIHDILEENGIDTVLAKRYKTKIIAESKI